MQKKPFNDIRVRQAINYALDRDAYIKVVYNGLGSVATSLLSPKVHYFKGKEAVPYDPAEVEIFIDSWSPSDGDADGVVRPLLSKESFPPHSFNLSYYNNPELEKYIAQGLSSADDKVRQDAYDKAQALIWKDIPVICMMNIFNTLACNANVTGVSIMPVGELSMTNAKLFQ